MGFQVGINALKAAVENAKLTGGGAPSGSRLNYFHWEDGEKKILRFVTDDYLYADMYEYILNNQGKASSFLVDPDDPERLERYRSPSPGVGWQKVWSGGLEEPKPKIRGVGIAVLRHEVKNPTGQGLVVEDVISEVEADGETLPARTFGLVIRPPRGFWDTLTEGCLPRFGTLTDRDYEITRTGTKLDTTYTIIPLPQVPELSDPETVREFYSYGQAASEDDPERFLKCSTTILDWASDHSSEDRHKFFLGDKKPGQKSEHHPEGNPWESRQVEAQDFRPMALSEPRGTEFSSLKSSGSFSSLQETLLARQRRG